MPTNTSLCLETVTYTYELTNRGNLNLTVVLANRTRNDDTISILPLLDTLKLAPAEVATATEMETVDLCLSTPQTFITVLRTGGTCP